MRLVHLLTFLPILILHKRILLSHTNTVQNEGASMSPIDAFMLAFCLLAYLVLTRNVFNPERLVIGIDGTALGMLPGVSSN